MKFLTALLKIVSMLGIIGFKKYQESTYELPVALGRIFHEGIYF